VGRARDAELEQRLLTAAWDLVTASGYDSLSLSQVATRAGGHRSDIYRRWSSKSQLVAEAVAANLPPVPEFDTGSLRGDLRAYLGALWESWSSDWIDGLLGMLADMDSEAERTFLMMSRTRAQPMRDAIVRAVQRGELTDVPDLALLGDLLEGPLMHRRLLGRQVMTLDELDALADIVHRLMNVTVHQS
jgi:AcrR family transcriptional regulator